MIIFPSLFFLKTARYGRSFFVASNVYQAISSLV